MILKQHWEMVQESKVYRLVFTIAFSLVTFYNSVSVHIKLLFAHHNTAAFFFLFFLSHSARPCIGCTLYWPPQPALASCPLTWSQGGAQYIHHGVVVDMGNVNHHPETIHLPHHPLHQGDIVKFKTNNIMSSMKAIHLMSHSQIRKEGLGMD